MTTYLLPNIFNSNIQYDKYFIFYNDVSKDKNILKIQNDLDNDHTKSIFQDSLAIREDLILREIKIKDGNKIYFKFDFLSTNDKDWNG